MESLDTDLLPREDEAASLLEVRLHSLDAAIEHALAEWERDGAARSALSTPLRRRAAAGVAR